MKTMKEFLFGLEKPFYPQCSMGGSCRETGFDLDDCPGCKFYLEMIDAMTPTIKNGGVPECKVGDTMYSIIYDYVGGRWTYLEYEVSAVNPLGTIWVDKNTDYDKLIDQFNFMICFDRDTAESRVTRLNRYERARRINGVLKK